MANSFGWHEIYRPFKQQSQILFSKPTGVIQRSKPLRRNAAFTMKDHEQKDFIGESEEFDSDQHIENLNDWHDELDVIKMPNLLGPSATIYSSNPMENQHYSFAAPPFSCQQILVQFDTFGPTFSLVPCSYQPFNNNQNVVSNPENTNYHNQI